MSKLAVFDLSSVRVKGNCGKNVFDCAISGSQSIIKDVKVNFLRNMVIISTQSNLALTQSDLLKRLETFD